MVSTQSHKGLVVHCTYQSCKTKNFGTHRVVETARDPATPSPHPWPFRVRGGFFRFHRLRRVGRSPEKVSFTPSATARQVERFAWHVSAHHDQLHPCRDSLPRSCWQCQLQTTKPGNAFQLTRCPMYPLSMRIPTTAIGVKQEAVKTS